MMHSATVLVWQLTSVQISIITDVKK